MLASDAELYGLGAAAMEWEEAVEGVTERREGDWAGG
jgi:hypothetical protein